ncbi:kinase-like domain-containing protein [Pseudomassariella vexata]|uniref:Phosphatidylinositol 3-kinase VPS34 n=1 Tax=Pseudomassariella vexata TaxID=1141098 RepID=A0A1Y2E7X2_9PEZI|nr:kinase-like domain-containing protein [Pseudomassariella vexata]ORY67639.1 kinase-like domain-containing protein [Pseudomassariella vexata]
MDQRSQDGSLFICRLGNARLSPTHPHGHGWNSSYSDLHVTVQVWAGSKPITVPVQTAYKPFKNDRSWNEWLDIPIPYKSLPLNSCLAITIWDVSPTGGKQAQGHAVPFGGTTLPLFDQDNQVQKGRLRCVVYRNQKADGNDNTTTPASIIRRRKGSKDPDVVVVSKEEEELERLDKLYKKYEMNEIPKVEWLDRLVWRVIEKRTKEATGNSVRSLQRQTNMAQEGLKPAQQNGTIHQEADEFSKPRPSKFTLHVELPRFDFPVVFTDHEYPPPPMSALQHLSASQSNVDLKPPVEVQFGPGINGPTDPNARLVRIYDPEVGAKDNPAESKHRRLVRSQHRHGILDKDLRPNAKVRDELNTIMAYSPTHTLSPEEKDLVWKFRYHLTKDKRALTKFVKSVNWQDQSEAKQAIQVIAKWSEIDVDDALELLGPTFDNSAVRAYAVERLRKADDDELLLYLLQLVQALKFEHIATDSDQATLESSSLATFLISRAVENFKLGNYLYWYLSVEWDDKSPEQGQEVRTMYAKVQYDFMMELTKRSGGEDTRNTIKRQAELITVLSKISGEIQASSETTVRKVERVKTFLADPKNEILTIEPPIPLPLDPSVMITGVLPEKTRVFKSSLSPIMVTFKTSSGIDYPMLFKTGDDLRQDQLVIQIITLMDQLLQKENLDLKLSPYKILATSTTAGASQFVPSQTFAAISSSYKKKTPALAYLQEHNPDERAYLGVRKEALETFVKSCAGYCVITYILGVGDRHLENLLLAPDGHFFHADFGFILGRDPKPFAPALKLSKEMVDVMGGSNPPSELYLQFKQYCFLAFTALRKSSNLILNLFSLMVHANIPDIKLEPDKAVLKVKERFHLDLNEEDAIRLLEDSLEWSIMEVVRCVGAPHGRDSGTHNQNPTGLTGYFMTMLVGGFPLSAYQKHQNGSSFQDPDTWRLDRKVCQMSSSCKGQGTARKTTYHVLWEQGRETTVLRRARKVGL